MLAKSYFNVVLSAGYGVAFETLKDAESYANGDPTKGAPILDDHLWPIKIEEYLDRKLVNGSTVLYSKKRRN